MKNLRFSEPCYAPPGVHDENTWQVFTASPTAHGGRVHLACCITGTDAMRICLHGCQTSIGPMDLSFQCAPKSRSPHQLEENKYPKMPNNITQLLSLVSAMRFKLFFNYKHFSSRMARISNKALRISKDLMPSLFPKTLQHRNGRSFFP